MRSFARLLIPAAALVVGASLAAKTAETHDITDLLRYVDRNTVLVVDIDNTILTSGQDLGTTKWGWNHVSRMEKMGYTHDEAMALTHAVFHQVWRLSEPRLVDERIPDVIRRFQKQGIKVLGLSNRDPSLAYVTSDQLCRLNIDLTRSSLDSDDFKVFAATETHYVEGILFVGDMGDKGKALNAFLRMVLQRPDKVVFVDDRMRNVSNVGAALRDLNIEYVGVWYRKGDEWVAGYKQDIANLQEQYFGYLLSDEDAEKLLRAGVTR